MFVKAKDSQRDQTVAETQMKKVARITFLTDELPVHCATWAINNHTSAQSWYSIRGKNSIGHHIDWRSPYSSTIRDS